MKLVCQSCGAALQLEAGVRTATCPYCESPHVLERPEDPNRPNPAFAIGFQIPRAEAHRRVREWLRRRTLFARSGVHRAKVDEVRGVYAPAYLYGAVAKSEFRADIGEHYWEEVTVGSGKDRRTERRQQTEWRPLAGRIATYVADRLVTASRAIGNQELERVEPFDLRLLARFRPEVVSGWIAEEPSMGPEECAALARGEAEQEVSKRLERFMPGDEHRGVHQQTALEEESLDLVLVPLWIFAARYAEDRPPVRILVNGQTGKAFGKVPLSWVKIGVTVLLALAAAAAIALYFGGRP